MKKFATVGIVAAVTAMLIACGSSGPSEKDTKRLNDNANNGVPNSAPVANKVINGGDWEVGKKDNLESGVITPGTYIVTVPENGFGCYWETVKNFDKTVGSIIANGNVGPGENARVVVKSSYKGLTLNGDCLATKKK